MDLASLPQREVDSVEPGAAEPAGDSSDTLTLYLRDVRRTQLFTREEELATAPLWQRPRSRRRPRR